MTVSFRIGRYLVALLWHWAPPAFIGFAVALVLTTFQMVEVLESFDAVYQCASVVASAGGDE